MTWWPLMVALALGAAGVLWLRRRNQVEIVDPLALILPLPEDLPPRTPPLEGVINFRDVGGYATADGRRVRTGLVYRSGALHAPTTADQQRLTDLGIRWVCDLRSVEEVAEEPDHLPPAAGIHYSHLPLDGEDNRRERLLALLFNRRQFANMMPDMYVNTLVERNAALYGSILRRLADPANLPAVIHCTAGKDRTGIATALLLRLLGVPEETVLADYSQSNRDHEAFFEYGVRAVRSLRRLGIRAEHIQPLLVADPRSLRAALSHIQTRYGGVDGYLTRAAGLDDSLLAALRANLLD